MNYRGMSRDMAIAYVKDKLAQGVSAGVLYGLTQSVEGHTHKFAVLYDEGNQMFLGETSFDGGGPHCHYIMVGVYDVMGSNEQWASENPQPRPNEFTLTDSNTPANLKRLMALWNRKVITLDTSFSANGEEADRHHKHSLILRYAGNEVDRMGRKVESSIFAQSLTEVTKNNKKLEDAKKKHEDLKNFLKDIK